MLFLLLYSIKTKNRRQTFESLSIVQYCRSRNTLPPPAGILAERRQAEGAELLQHLFGRKGRQLGHVEKRAQDGAGDAAQARQNQQGDDGEK